MLGQPLPIVPADKRREFQEFLGRSIDGETLVDVELRRQKRDGSPIDIALSTAPLYDPSGANRGVVSIAVDVSRRKQAEAEAREHRDALRAVIESAPIAIYALDRAGRVTLWNPAAERILGWSEREMLGHPLPTVPEDRRAEFQALLERAQSGESLSGVEVRRQRKGGELLDLLLSTAPVRDAEGGVRGTVHLAVDITEQKQAPATAPVSSRSSRSIGQLAGGVAHDFNNLLSVIMGRSPDCCCSSSRRTPPSTGDPVDSVHPRARAASFDEAAPGLQPPNRRSNPRSSISTRWWRASWPCFKRLHRREHGARVCVRPSR